MVREFIDEYCPEGGGLSRSQLIDVALRFLMMRTEEEIDKVILGILTGKWDQTEERSAKKSAGGAGR